MFGLAPFLDELPVGRTRIPPFSPFGPRTTLVIEQLDLPTPSVGIGAPEDLFEQLAVGGVEHPPFVEFLQLGDELWVLTLADDPLLDLHDRDAFAFTRQIHSFEIATGVRISPSLLDP